MDSGDEHVWNGPPSEPWTRRERYGAFIEREPSPRSRVKIGVADGAVIMTALQFDDLVHLLVEDLAAELDRMRGELLEDKNRRLALKYALDLATEQFKDRYMESELTEPGVMDGPTMKRIAELRKFA